MEPNLNREIEDIGKPAPMTWSDRLLVALGIGWLVAFWSLAMALYHAAP